MFGLIELLDPWCCAIGLGSARPVTHADLGHLGAGPCAEPLRAPHFSWASFSAQGGTDKPTHKAPL